VAKKSHSGFAHVNHKEEKSRIHPLRCHYQAAWPPFLSSISALGADFFRSWRGVNKLPLRGTAPLDSIQTRFSGERKHSSLLLGEAQVAVTPQGTGRLCTKLF
jgi:hypothetical protein